MLCLVKEKSYTQRRSVYLRVVQLQSGVVVVGVVVHPLVHHCYVAVDFLPAFLQGPVLSTLPPTALVRPAAPRHVKKTEPVQDYENRNTCDPFGVGGLPCCHDDQKHVLIPDHSPEIPVGPVQWSCDVHGSLQHVSWRQVHLHEVDFTKKKSFHSKRLAVIP